MRDLQKIDADIALELGWVRIEERLHGNRTHPEVQAATARVDALLEERSDVVLALQYQPPGAIDA